MELVKILDKNRAQKPFEQFCVFKIARAWLDLTKYQPTFSNNINELTGRATKTRFQRYLAEAVAPRTIGPGNAKTAINALNISLGA